MTSKKQAQGKDHVQLYCNENPTSDSEGNDHQKWAIIQGFEVSKRIAVTDIANIVSTLPKVTYAEALMTSKTQVEGKDHVQSHCAANSTSDSEGNVHQKWVITQRCEVSNACCDH